MLKFNIRIVLTASVRKYGYAIALKCGTTL